MKEDYVEKRKIVAESASLVEAGEVTKEEYEEFVKSGKGKKARSLEELFGVKQQKK